MVKEVEWRANGRNDAKPSTLVKKLVPKDALILSSVLEIAHCAAAISV